MQCGFGNFEGSLDDENLKYKLKYELVDSRVAEVGWLSVNATKSLRAFVERVFANFRDKNVVFYD